MRIPCYYIVLNLLLSSSMISANPLNSLSRRDRHDFVAPSKMSVLCEQAVIYSNRDLDLAAKEVCCKVKIQTECRGFIPCHSIKKAMPTIQKDLIYSGKPFNDSKNQGSLLKWSLPHRGPYKRTAYYAIVYLDPETKTCQTIGAVKFTGRGMYERCSNWSGGNKPDYWPGDVYGFA